MSGYFPGPWPGEDGGPHRPQIPGPGPHPDVPAGTRLAVTWRLAPAVTMAVTRRPGQVYLLRHTAGDEAVSFVERIDPHTLEPVGRSADLSGGPAWPGSLAAHANGSLYVVFGNHAHRLDAGLTVQATATLPRDRPYNGFVILPDGHLVTKDFAGSRPGAPVPAGQREPCELIVLEPEGLTVVDRCPLPEPSIARLSALGDTVYIVGDTSLLRARWNGRLRADPDFRVRYRTVDGQGYGWDCVLAAGAAWFLDNGEGTEGYDGSLHGHGRATAPLHLVRVDLDTGATTLAEVDPRPGGLVANPPLVDPVRAIAVGYDSGNGVLKAFDVGAGGGLTTRWVRNQEHGAHLLLLPGSGALITGDFDRRRQAEQVVVLDIATGEERARADTGSPVQSVLFHAVGFDRDLYLCTFTTVTRVVVDTD